MDLRVILPSCCDVCLHSCWVSVGAREPDRHYHFFVQAGPAIMMMTMVIQTRPAAIMMMVMMITMVAGMVPACCVLRALGGSKSDPSKCL